MRPLIAGNWKMNGTAGSLPQIAGVAQWAAENASPADILICPPFTLISRATAIAEGRIAIGGQDCHPLAAGAFTGDVSAEMLRDAGASAVIVGHSETRRYHAETNEVVAAKVDAAWRTGLLAILCVGETEPEYDAGRAREVVTEQLEASLPAGAAGHPLAVAYEPVWSIGSGRTPSDDDITRIHALIRTIVDGRLGGGREFIRVLYGGSVKPGNAVHILRLPGVNGALVGGASLTAVGFLDIIRSVPGA
jgi:triosephosphate isomerase